MGAFTALLSIALATHAVSIDGYPLRKGCDAGEPVIARLHKGDPAEIRFAVAGAGAGCYKISVRSGGRTLEGYVSEDAITGVDEFEQARRNAPATVLLSASGAGAAATRKDTAGGSNQDAGARAARLLEANRPQEALETLEPVLRSGRRDPGLLSLAGYAAYRGDDVRRAMEYWKQSLALQPNPIVERLYRKAEQEAREDKSGEKLVGTRFLLRYNRRQMSRATAHQVLDTLEREFSRISAQLGCRVDERIVAIVQSPEEYRRTTDAAEWSGGQYTGRIRVAALDQSRLGEQTREALAHEIVHACLAGLGDFPVWLHEGLAQKLSGRTLTAGEWARVKQLARSGQLPRLENLTQTWSRMSTFHAAIAYETALAAVELFDQNYAGLGVRNLLRNPHLLPQITADLDRRLRE